MAYISSKSTQFLAFNAFGIESAQAIIDAAADRNRDVIIQTSVSVLPAMPLRLFTDFVHSYSYDRGIKAYVHLDHCRDLDIIIKAIDSGYDSVMIDASHQSLDENIRLTNKIKAIAHNRGLLVEAELGRIVGVEDEITANDSDVVSLKDIERFIDETGVDMLAVAIGTKHGIYREKVGIDYSLIDEISLMTDTPFVVHGGSGLPDETLKKLFSHSNVKKINISTEVKLAYKSGIEQSIEEGFLNSSLFDAKSVKDKIHNSIYRMVSEKLKVLG